MDTYKDIANTIDNDNKTKSICKCNKCEKIIEGKPWATYYSVNNNLYTYMCSYICNKYYDKKYENMWEDLVNKEDFNLPHPYMNIKPKVKEDFVFLPIEVIKAMSNEEYEFYMQGKEEYYFTNPVKAEIEEEMAKEEDYVNSLNKSTSFSEDEIYTCSDDY